MRVAISTNLGSIFSLEFGYDAPVEESHRILEFPKSLCNQPISQKLQLGVVEQSNASDKPNETFFEIPRTYRDIKIAFPHIASEELSSEQFLSKVEIEIGFQL